ncbi:MAG: histidinol-phosphate transaminase [Bacteroidota bacterium]
MDFNQLQSLVRPHILEMKPYASARSEYTGSKGIFLDANENPIGSATQTAYNRYPDPLQKALKEKVAQEKGVRPEQIFLGNGSDEAIDLLIRAFCEPGEDHLLLLPPTYGMYEVSANINKVAVQKVSLTSDFQLDVPAIQQALSPSTKLVFICSPNNPTGNLMEAADILTILDSHNEGLVIVDEAYIDFASTKGFVPFLDAYPHLVVMQTFSKAWGLAGLRLGMAFANPFVINVLNRIKPPYNLNQVTQELGMQALEHAKAKDHMVGQLLGERERVLKALENIPGIHQVFPSDANFLLVKMENAQEVYNSLLEKLIILRNRSYVHLCEGSLRISIGTPEENEQMLRGLQRVLANA